MKLPVVLLHGYSDRGASFDAWRTALTARGYEVADLHVGSYRSLTNEVSLKDIAEGVDRALRMEAGLSADEPFDAIVHSTGALVMRAWLTAYAGRRDRLKHFVQLAPANFGSPMAHKGRSWLGAVFKGNRELGPDFLEAGDRILAALELGSPFTWELAHLDLIGAERFYGPTRTTPYVFVLCGTRSYGGLRRLIAEPGADGVVRWAGCALNLRKIVLDLTRDPSVPEQGDRVHIAPWSNVEIPLVLVPGVNHGTILRAPTPALIDLVERALGVGSGAQYEAWCAEAARLARRASGGSWQQFIVRARDERGDPVPDYHLQLFTRTAGGRRTQVIRNFAADVHTFSDDPSYRCFHVDLDTVKPSTLRNLWVRIIASSGSRLVAYHGYGSEKSGAGGIPIADGKWDATLDISSLLEKRGELFFYPNTTTFVELILNREPLPLSGRNEVAWFGAAG